MPKNMPGRQQQKDRERKWAAFESHSLNEFFLCSRTSEKSQILDDTVSSVESSATLTTQSALPLEEADTGNTSVHLPETPISPSMPVPLDIGEILSQCASGEEFSKKVHSLSPAEKYYLLKNHYKPPQTV